jgi:2-desacetyl-2-hydroxyethyl bacteriochlorophyllide A dehydrogenase
MKQAILYGPRDLRLENFSLDTRNLQPDQIWVKTELTALSTGTDRGNYEGAEQVPGAPPYPRWVGYSNVGEVQAVGDRVTRLQPGDRVFALKAHASDYVAEESEPIVRIQDGIPAEDAVFTKLYHLGYHSLRRGELSFGERVAVIGLGVLGLASVELARVFGGRVIAIGNSEIRIAQARELGAHLAVGFDDPECQEKIDDFTEGEGVELVILATNPWPAYKVGMEIVGEGGRIAVLSLLGRGEDTADFNPLAMEWLYQKSLTITGVSLTARERQKLARDFTYLLSLMVDGSIRPSRLITHRLPFEQINEAYEMAYFRDKSMIGTIFQWH